MKKDHPAWILVSLVTIFAATSFSASAADVCFAAAKIYQIHPLHGGADSKNGWSVRGDAFNQCVRRAEAADKKLHAQYPVTIYALSLASTIGCHAC